MGPEKTTRVINDHNTERLCSGSKCNGLLIMALIDSSGQRLAEQMQQSNPELVENLRRQMGSTLGNNQNEDGENKDQNNDQNPPPGTS